jgi:hypothetical protein
LTASISRILAKPVPVIGIGWAVGGALGAYLSWTQDWYPGVILIGIVTGATTGLVLKRMQKSVTLISIAIMCVAWLSGGVVSEKLDNSLPDAVSNVFGGLMDTDFMWKLGWLIGAYLAGALGGAIGGIVTGLLLRGRTQSIHWKQVWIIALGWAGAYGIAWIAALASGEITSWEDMWSFVVGSGFGYLICGLIGAIVMFSQLRRSTARPE